MVKSTKDYFDNYQKFHLKPGRKKGRETFDDLDIQKDGLFIPHKSQ